MIYPPASETHEKGLDFFVLLSLSLPVREVNTDITRKENYNSVRCRYPIFVETVAGRLVTNCGGWKLFFKTTEIG